MGTEVKRQEQKEYQYGNLPKIRLKDEYTFDNAVQDISVFLTGGGLVVESGKMAAKRVAAETLLTETAPMVAKNAGRAALGVSVAIGAYETYQAYEEGGTTAAIKKGTSAAAGIAMSAACAKAGALLCAPAGPIAAGAGALIGGIAGYFAGEKIIECVQYIREW